MDLWAVVWLPPCLLSLRRVAFVSPLRRFDVLPHLIRTGAICAVSAVFAEWHEQFFTRAMIAKAARAFHHQTTLGGVAGANGVLAAGVRGAIEAALNRTAIPDVCKTRVMAMEDETYGEPWRVIGYPPPGSLCDAVHFAKQGLVNAASSSRRLSGTSTLERM